MSTNTNPLKIIGKEFLYKNEDWYYVNFNPFITSNSLDTLNENNKNFNSSVNVYIFDKTNFNEPTKEQFSNFKSIEDINTYKTNIAISNNVNINNVLLFSELNIQSTYMNDKRTIELTINLTQGVVPKLISTQDFSILDNFFTVIEIPIIGTKKLYNDIPSSISNAYIMIPSTRCFNLNLASQQFKDWYFNNFDLTIPEKESLLKNFLPNYDNLDIILEESTTLINMEPVATIKSIDNPAGDGIYGGFEFNEVVVDITNVDDIFEDNSSLATFTFNDTTNDLGLNFLGNGYTILDKNADTSITNPDNINPENLSSTLNIFGDNSCLACYKFDGNANDVGGAHNGTASNISYTTVGDTTGSALDIETSRSAIFNGTNSNIKLTGKGATLWYSGDRSVSLWFKSSTHITSTQSLVSRAAAGESTSTNFNSASISIANSTQTQFYFFRETGSGTINLYYITVNNINIVDDNWHNIVFVYTSTTIDAYIDGKVVGSVTGMVAADTTAPDLFIGTSGDGAWYLKGNLDQLRFFNKKLTYHEIQLLQTEKRIKLPKFVDGKFGKAIVCDKTSLFQTEASIQGNVPFTIAGWYKNTGEMEKGYSSTSASNNALIFSFQDTSETGVLNNGNLVLYYYPLSNSLILHVRSSTTGTIKRYTFDGNLVIDINQYNHFALTYNGGKEFYSFNLFVNGIEVPLNGQILTGETSFTGFDKRLYFTPSRSVDKSAAWFNISSGQYEQFRMFNKILKAEEILTCMYGVKPDPSTIQVPDVPTKTITVGTVLNDNALAYQYTLERDYDNFENGSNLVFETLPEVFPLSCIIVKSIIQDGYVYVFVGVIGNSSTQTTQVRMGECLSVYQAKVNNDGTLGTFSKVGRINSSVPLYSHNILQYKDKVLVLGGQYQNYSGNTVVDASSSNTVYVMNINKVSGNAPTIDFSFLGYMPIEMYGANAWIHTNRIYCASGWSNQSGSGVYLNNGVYAEIYEEIDSLGNSNITLSEWVETGVGSVPTRYAAGIIQTKSRIYWIGGHNGTAYSNSIIYRDLPNQLDTDGNIDYNSNILANTSYITDTLTFPVTCGWLLQTFVTDKYAYVIGMYSNGTYNSNAYVAPIDEQGHLGQFVLMTNTNLTNNTYSAIIPTDKYLYCIGGYQSGSTGTAITNNLIRRAPLPAFKNSSTSLTSTPESYNYYPERLIQKTKQYTKPKNEISTLKKLDPFDDNSGGVLWDFNDKLDVDAFNVTTYTSVNDLYGPSTPGFVSEKSFMKSAGQYVNGASFTPNSNGFNISLFVRFNSYPFGAYPDSSMTIWSFGTVSVLNGMSLMFSSSKEFLLNTRGITSNVQVINGTLKTIDLSKRYHVSVNVSLRKAEIYLDGELYRTYLYSTNISLPAGINLGREIYTSSYFMDGYMDQVRYFSKILTKDSIKALTKEKITVDSNLREPDFKNIRKEKYKIPYSCAGGKYINTGKRLYRYDGYSTDRTTSDFSSDNAIYYADILEDSSLSGWKYAGANPLGLIGHFYVYEDKFVYNFAGYTFNNSTKTYTQSNSIKRAPINFDGSIGAWTSIGTTNIYARSLGICKNESDPSIVYVYGGYGGSTSTASGYYNYIFTYKINDDASITLLNTVTCPYIHGNALYHIKDTATNKEYLFQLGEYQATPTLLNNGDIYKIELIDNLPVISTRIKVGSFTYSKDSGRLPLKTDTDIYQVGWTDQRLATPVKGIDRRIEKINISAMLNATPGTFVTSTLIDYKLPDNFMGGFIETDYGWYMMAREYGDSTNPSNWVDTTTPYFIPKFKRSKNLVPKTSYLPAKLNTSLSNTIKGKVFTRYKEEYYSNLVVKESQTLSNFGESIKFKDPINGNIITLTELTKPTMISKLEEIFLEWLSNVTKETALDNYNAYYYTNSYGLNTAREYNIVVPEIIFNLITNKNMMNINKIVLEQYLIDYPLDTYAELYTKFISYGYIDTDFNIPNILKTFTNAVINTDIRIPLTTDSNKLVLPKFNSINYNPLKIDYNYIFIPQKNKNKEILGSTLPPLYSDAIYFDNTGSCNYKKRPNFDDIYNQVLVDPSLFDFYISPTGNDSNPGTITLPKKTVGACTDGKKILLLPGTYSQLWTYDWNYGTIPLVFQGMWNHMVFGCGDSTIINCVGAWQGRDKHLVVSGGSSGRICNLKVNWSSEGSGSYENALIHNAAGGFCIIGVNFNFTPSNPYYSLNYNNNGGTIYYYECNFINGSRVGNYSGSQDLIATMPDWYRGMVNTISTISPASLAASTYKGHYNNIISAVEFIPAYTLLPISDDSNSDDNSIILENTSNITSIPNFEFKL